MTPEFDKDRTFDPVSEYGSERWVAATLGSTLDWLKKRRNQLEAEGLPAKDPLIGLTMKADVRAFLARRRRVSDPAPTAQMWPVTTGVNHDNL